LLASPWYGLKERKVPKFFPEHLLTTKYVPRNGHTKNLSVINEPDTGI